ncbi:chemotaxis protein CheW [Peptococcaceae bacterium]|nr:chemotaxis protein CheW [Peptococcaceae bacterium]
MLEINKNTSETSISEISNNISVNDNQVIVFQLANQKYALPLHQTQEIIKMSKITQIPNADFYLEGVINLRGTILPVINLRRRLGFADQDTSKDTRIIVTETSVQNIGIMVDKVLQVGQYNQSEIEPPDAVNSNSDFLKGIIKKKDALWLLLDIDKVL